MLHMMARKRDLKVPVEASADSLLIDVGQVAAMLAVSTSTVWRLRDQGQLPAPIRIGSLVRWRLGDIERFIRPQDQK